jgi:predicted RNase H-like HicB family nuclease
MASSSESEDAPPEQEILLRKEEGIWVAKDVETGVATQGESRREALANLDEAMALGEGTTGREPTEEEMREAGIDPEENETGDTEPPDVLE